MDITELSEEANYHINEVEKKLALVRFNQEKRKNWETLLELVTEDKNFNLTDTEILMKMHDCFGQHSLRRLIEEIGESHVDRYTKAEQLKASDLKLFIKR